MDWTEFVQTAGIILSLLVSVGNLKTRTKDDAATLAKMQVDIEYIKQQVGVMGDIQERLVRVEDSAAAAHRRMDRAGIDRGTDRTA